MHIIFSNNIYFSKSLKVSVDEISLKLFKSIKIILDNINSSIEWGPQRLNL